MEIFSVLSAVEQVAAHLRVEISQGRWIGTIPGADCLAAELGVNRKTMEAALRQLELENLLINQGRRRGRLIKLPAGAPPKTTLRVAILTHATSDLEEDYIFSLRYALEKAGHDTLIPGKTMNDFKLDVGRLGRLVKQTAAEAWVVVAGSREVLEWFIAQEVPTFALFGRRAGLAITGTGPDMLTVYLAATRRLIALGHRRIVNIVRNERRTPILGTIERAFCAELESHGISTGPYNLPNWEETGEGLEKLLRSLFHASPPTALILDEAAVFIAALQFLARRKIQVPEDVSLFCGSNDPTFSLCVPAISHIRWDHRPAVRSIVRWANHVAHGKDDRRQTLSPAEFVIGGTIGPARGG
jgi:DNA-binding LacI/PurR family transcriptional regulator